jgi:putative IMPACT (imprinted ancient) family translation regulator
MLKEKYLPSRLQYNKQQRINRLNIKMEEDNKSKEFEDKYIVIAIDSNGIKVTNRDQWMRDKWNVRKKGYLKIHV